MKKCYLLWLLCCLTLCPTFTNAEENTPTNLLKNPSFEQNGSGKIADWSFPQRSFSISDEFAHDGKYSVKYHNEDPNRYDFFNQSIPFQSGERYDFSCMVRTKDIKGNETGATICIQWSDKNGKFLGGSFPNGVVTTGDQWIKITGRTSPIPKEAGDVTLSLYLRPNMTGTAWFDSIEVHRFIPPLINQMTTNRYRHQAIGGEVKVGIGFNTLAYLTSIDKIKPTLTITGDHLDKPIQAQYCESCKNGVIFSFDSTPLAVGSYTLTVKTINPKTNKEESLSLPFTKLKSFPDRKAWIDEHRRLILDGKPFFPIGLYFGSVSDEHLNIYSKSKFNCLMPYANISRETLDKIHTAGIKVIYSVKDLYKGAGGIQTEKQADDRVTTMVNRLKDHPAIMAWYINDEYPLIRLAELSGRRNLMEKLDPSRPTWAVLYQIDEIRGYLPTFDVGGTDPYPIAKESAKLAWDWSKKTNGALFQMKAVWQVPQNFDWSIYRTSTDDKKGERFPTFEELRGMYWMNIAGGANGVIGYCWFDLIDSDKGPSPEASRRPNVRTPFETSWKYTSTVAEEISDAIPILLSIDKPIELKSDQKEDALTVGSRLYGSGKTTWLLAVNLLQKENTAVWTSPVPIKITQIKLGNEKTRNSNVKLEDNKLTVHFSSFEPILIGIEEK